MLVGALITLVAFRLLTGYWGLKIYVLWWLLGAVAGFLFVFTDRLVNVVVTNPDSVLSVKVKEVIKRKSLVLGLRTLLIERNDQERLMMRSGLFVAVWLFLGFWGLLFVTHPLGRGLLAGIGIHLMFDLGWDYFNKGVGVNHWFWQIKRALSPKEIRGFVWVVFVVSAAVIGGL